MKARLTSLICHRGIGVDHTKAHYIALSFLPDEQVIVYDDDRIMPLKEYLSCHQLSQAGKGELKDLFGRHVFTPYIAAYTKCN